MKNPPSLRLDWFAGWRRRRVSAPLAGLAVLACGLALTATPALVVYLATRQGLDAASVGRLAAIVALGGLTLSILVSRALWSLLSSREQAERLAEGMVSDLQRMAAVVERTSSAVFGLDPQGRITWANQGFERLTGLPARDCTGRPAAELPQVVGIDPHARAAFEDAIARRQARRIEMANQRPDGSHFWTDAELQPMRDASGGLIGFICVATDISRRKVAELRMQEGERLMRVITDNLPARVSYWDARRRCRFVNRRFCEVFGRSSEELVGAYLSPQIYGDALYAELVPHVEAVLAGQPQYFEHRMRDSRGRESYWQMHYLPDFDGAAVKGFFVLGMDVTELRRARDTALEASQAKSRFLSSMSHEIRTPLNAVLGMLALLRGTDLDTRQQDHAAKAERAARSLLSLLNDILDLSKIEAGKMTLSRQVFCIDDVVQDLGVVLAGNVGEKPVTLQFDIDPAVPRWLYGDELRLRQVLINLGGNAIKFTERGRVTLRIVLLERQGEQVRLEVSLSDTGIGIASGSLGRIFDDFTQADGDTAARFGGTGLGLAISRKLLALMDTELQVASAPGEGSRFWFELTVPLAPEGVARSAAKARKPQHPLAGLKLLLVEDNIINQEVAGELLRKQGAEVEVASDGREGLDRVLADPSHFDAVLMDVLMPVMDGHAATRAIRASGNWRLPVIAITANAMEADRVECLSAGMNDHVGKPFDIDQLVQVVLRHTRRADPALQPELVLLEASALVHAAADDQAHEGIDSCRILDRQAAIQGLGGDAALYERLLPSFEESLRGTRDRLPTLLHSIEHTEADRLLDTLERTARTLGAAPLAEAAREAGACLQGDATRQAAGLRALEDAIDLTLSRLTTRPANAPN